MITGPIYETHPYYYNGTFKSLINQIPSIKELGINIIYLMPIWKRFDENVLWDVYSINNYYNIDSVYGTPHELQNLIDKVHAYGMKIIFDLVTVFTPTNSTIYNNNWALNISLDSIKSTALKYRWTLKYIILNGINYVYTGENKYGPYTYDFYGAIIGTNVIVYTFPAIWGPAVDRANPQVIDYFIKVAEYYVQNYNIDGWRIDAPGNNYNSLVFPSDHSSTKLITSIINAIRNIKPNAIFISESGLPRGISSGIDLEYVYIPLIGIMPNIIANNITSSQLVTQLMQQSTIIRPLFIVESHDLPRLNEAYPLQDKNFMVLISTFYGSPFMQTGQEIGATNNWSNAQVNWSTGDYKLRDFYIKVLSIRNSNNAIQYGTPIDIWKS